MFVSSCTVPGKGTVSLVNKGSIETIQTIANTHQTQTMSNSSSKSVVPKEVK